MPPHAEAIMPGLSLFLGEKNFQTPRLIEHFLSGDFAEWYRRCLRYAFGRSANQRPHLHISALVLIALLLAGEPLHAQENSHCRPDERTYFNCKLPSKLGVASVCGAGYIEEDKKSGYLQYRSGNLGAPAFVFPATSTDAGSLDQFTFSATRSRNYDRNDYELQFESGGYVYAVHSAKVKPFSQARYTASVTVRKLLVSCSGACAPYAVRPNRILRTYACSNGDAGKEMVLGPIIRLMTSQGRSFQNQF